MRKESVVAYFKSTTPAITWRYEGNHERSHDSNQALPNSSEKHYSLSQLALLRFISFVTTMLYTHFVCEKHGNRALWAQEL